MPVLLTAWQVEAQPGAYKFNFGSDPSSSKMIRVRGSDTYSREKGFGFEAGNRDIVCPGDRSTKRACSSAKPFYFSVALPEGNYRASITFGDRDATSTTVKAELRRLMLERVDTRPGEFDTRTFVVNVRTPVISTGGEVKLKDRERTTRTMGVGREAHSRVQRLTTLGQFDRDRNGKRTDRFPPRRFHGLRPARRAICKLGPDDHALL